MINESWSIFEALSKLGTTGLAWALDTISSIPGLIWSILIFAIPCTFIMIGLVGWERVKWIIRHLF